jgi:uncharacterized membrane protein YbhN (UPF0104 family)
MVLSLAISLGLLVFVFQQINFFQAIKLIRQAFSFTIFNALIILVIGNIFVNSYRWKLILTHLGCNVSWTEALFVKTVSYSVINILPFRIGELSRIVYLRRKREISYSTSVISIVCEYILNFIIAAFAIAVGGGGYIFYNPKFLEFGLLGKSTLFVGCLGRKQEGTKNIYYKISNKVFYPILKYFKKVKPVFRDFKVISFSIIDLGLDLFAVWLLTQALGFSLPMYVILLFVVVMVLTNIIPFSVQGVGIREVSVLFLFGGFASAEELISLSILYFIMGGLVPMVIGSSLVGLYVNRMVQNNA